MQKYANVATDLFGNVVPSATVTVYAAGTTTPSTIYSDNISTAKANPFTTGTDGVLFFYAANGRYDVKIAKTGYTFNTDATYDVVLYDAAAVASTGNDFRLIKSGANLTLSPIVGNSINIGGTVYVYTTMPILPGAATLVEGGACAANTLYYIYLRDVGGVATLEVSSTAYTLDSAGRPMRTGDNTRRCAGIVATDPSTTDWIDTEQYRRVCSYDNRRSVQGRAWFTAARTAATGGTSEVNSEIRVSFITFVEDSVTASFIGTVAASAAAGSNAYTYISLDGIASLLSPIYYTSCASTTDVKNISTTMSSAIATGSHFLTVASSVSGTDSTVYSGNATSTSAGNLIVNLRQ
jgi:hypothetical protein